MFPSTVRQVLGIALSAFCASWTVPPVGASQDAPSSGPTTGFVLLFAQESALEIEHRLDPTYLAGRADLLPVATTWIAIPPGAEVSAHLTVLEEAPAAWVDQLGSAQRAALLESLEEEDVALLGEPTVLRNQAVVQLRHSWLRRGRDGSVRQIMGARFSVTIDPREADAFRRARGADAFEGLYRSVLINYEQGRAWRLARARPAPRRGSDYFSSTEAPWIKVWCNREDLFAIRGADLEALGVVLELIDPLTLRMVAPRQTPLAEAVSVEDAAGWMSPLAIHLEGMEDGRFDPTDRILFLGYGPDAWFTSKGFTQPGLEAFARDPYANENPYWLTWGGSFTTPPARMEEVPAGDTTEPLVDRVRDRIHLEEDTIYDPRMRELGIGAADWELYWWRARIANQDRDDDSPITVTVPDPVESAPVSVFARFWGANNLQGDPTIPDHDLELLLNESFIDRRTWEGYNRNDFEGEGLWLQTGDTRSSG